MLLADPPLIAACRTDHGVDRHRQRLARDCIKGGSSVLAFGFDCDEDYADDSDRNSARWSVVAIGFGHPHAGAAGAERHRWLNATGVNQSLLLMWAHRWLTFSQRRSL